MYLKNVYKSGTTENQYRTKRQKRDAYTTDDSDNKNLVDENDYDVSHISKTPQKGKKKLCNDKLK